MAETRSPDQYVIERNHWWFRARRLLMLEYLRNQLNAEERAQRKILILGGSTGADAEHMLEFGQVIVYEEDEQRYQNLQPQEGLSFQSVSYLDLPDTDDSYDLVCAFDLLENMQDDKGAVLEMMRVCKPGGVVLISVPAFPMLWGGYDEYNNHFRRYSLPALQRLFGTRGTLIFGSYYGFWLFLPILVYRTLVRPVLGPMGAFSNPKFKKAQAKVLPNRSLYRITASEKIWIKRSKRLPFGFSCLAAWQK